MKYSVVVIVVIMCGGCAYENLRVEPLLMDYGRFGRSEMIEDVCKGVDQRYVTVRLNDVPFGVAMRMISDIEACSVIWDCGLDNTSVTGYFDNVPLVTVLETLGRRVGAEVHLVGDVYYVGELRADDLAAGVMSAPPGAMEAIRDVAQSLVSNRGRVSVFGGMIMVRDTVDNLSKISRVIEEWRVAGLRRYYAELWFVSMRESDWVRLGVEAQVQSVDLLEAGNVKELFGALLRGEVDLEHSSTIQAPVLQLAEGVEGRIDLGREVPLEIRAVTDSGVVETVDYEILSDGVSIKLLVRRVSNELLGVDVVTDISEFEEISGDTRPVRASRQVRSTILLVPGEVVLVGGVGRRANGKAGSLFVIERGSEQETILVWLRVREIESVGNNGVLAKVSEGKGMQ